ncbi:DUF3006 domain-containing protein [Salipaludibacillus aurantiacus]|uniref:DUF3006 domain-containing protein n=1 Tax=Salipaludibacillus aurantiacus TaxID=1601833 RepID=A0A1H9W6P4_9BACI|nr:DUF3006 domain-containing protein [Salipaludibacillus aurantiacus]SES29464.1 Protein of unknown function [Salipaludibacillus aurantiacus]
MAVDGFLDRIEDGKFGVILVEDIGKEYMVPKNNLPDGAREGMWLTVTIEDEEVKSIEINRTKTIGLQQKIDSQMERIRKKKKGSKFKRK